MLLELVLTICSFNGFICMDRDVYVTVRGETVAQTACLSPRVNEAVEKWMLGAERVRIKKWTCAAAPKPEEIPLSTPSRV